MTERGDFKGYELNLHNFSRDVHRLAINLGALRRMHGAVLDYQESVQAIEAPEASFGVPTNHVTIIGYRTLHSVPSEEGQGDG